jgi:hypothetical protein
MGKRIINFSMEKECGSSVKNRFLFVLKNTIPALRRVEYVSHKI